LESNVHEVSLIGRIAEILEQDGQKRVRIYCEPDIILLTLEAGQDYYLGERLLLKGTLNIENIQEDLALN